MPTKIKTSDFVENSGDIKQLIEELKQLRSELTSVRDEEIEKALLLQKVLKKLNPARKKDREEVEEAAKQAEEIAKRQAKYNASLEENAKKLAQLKNAQSEINRVNKLEAKLLKAKKGSYDQLSAQYSLNKIKLNQMTKEERKATKEGRELVKVTNEIYQEMKQLQEETGKHTLSVGDYAKANEALIERLEELPGALSNVGGGLNDLDNNFKKLARNPFLFLLSIVISGVLALGQAFKSSDKGARLLEKATATLSALFSNLVELSVDIAEGIEYAFNNPIQAVKDLGAAIVKNITNRFKGLIDLAVELGAVIGAAVTLNLQEAEEAAKRASDALIQVGTGLDKEQQKAFTDAVKETVSEIEKEIAAFQKLSEARLATQRSNRSLTRSIETLATKEAVLRANADDTTKSFAEREKAAQDARDALEKKNNLEIQVARNNLRLINQEIDLRRANGENIEQLLDGQLQAYQELKQAERELTLSVIDNERTRAELKQDRLERDLDILIDGFDNQKTINEKLINDDELTFEKRRQILEETRRLSDDSFAKQIETIQKFTGVNVDANELIAESDAVALNQKIRSLGLSEIIEGRLLEIIRDRKSANQDLADSEKDLNKAIEKNLSDQEKFRISLIKKAKKAYEDFQKARKEGTLKAFEQQQELAQSEFDLLETTEQEKTRFALNAEKERIQKLIEINKRFGGDLTDVQLQTFKNQIEKIDQELDKLGQRQVNDVYDLFGFKLTDEKKSALNESLSFVKQQFSELFNTRVQLSQQAVQASNDEVAAAQRQLEIEIQNRNAGFDHKVETAEKELEAAKRNQEKAVNEQRKAQRQQQAIQTLEQSVNLITASSKIWQSFSGLGPFGPFLAAAAISTMFGSFIAAKIKANQLSKKTFGDGGLEIIGGGTHASGDDTYLGFHSEGKPAFGERGEAHIIIPATKTKKYKSILPHLVDSLRNGTFEKNYASLNASHVSGDGDIYIQTASSGTTDTSVMEDHLSVIRHNSEKSSSVNAKGQDVIRYKNLTTTYV